MGSKMKFEQKDTVGSKARPFLSWLYHFVHHFGVQHKKVRQETGLAPALWWGLLEEKLIQYRLGVRMSCSQAIVFHGRLCALLMSISVVPAMLRCNAKA